MEPIVDNFTRTELQTTFAQENQLTPEEEAQVTALADGIDISSTNALSMFGSEAGQKLSALSSSSLEKAKTKSIGEAGDALVALNKDLKGYTDYISKDPKKGIFGFLQKSKDRVANIMAKHASVQSNIDKSVALLNQHVSTLRVDITQLDSLYHESCNYFRELSMYIAAGKKRYETERDTTLKTLLDKASETHQQSDIQAANDFKSRLDTLQESITFLEFARSAVLNIAPSIRLTQNNELAMCNRIQQSITINIPIWQTSVALALGQEHTKTALEATQATRKFTSELIKHNAEQLKELSLGVAEEQQKGPYDVEAVVEANDRLIETFDGVRAIQLEGEKVRVENEKRLEAEDKRIRDKLLEISTYASA